MSEETRYLTFALGKGRLANKTLELLEEIGITCEEMKDKSSRKLIFVDEEHKLRFFLAKGPDVPTYVEYGAADIGVVGKDTILEEGRRIYEVLDLVGLVREHADRYPHEFSGGQRQRIGIARAIVLEPDLIIADEPISALDVSIQAQVINLLNDLRNKMGLTIMFIAHNLSVVKYFSDRIGVMYYGKLVELADSDELFEHPLHPYTKSLLSAIPYPDPHHEKHRQRIEYKPLKEHDYSVNKPSLREIKPGHFINCNDEEFERYKKELGL